MPHLNKSDINREFDFNLKKRYWVNDEFFDGTGPVFLMIGGEGEENPIWMKNGQWINYAKIFVNPNSIILLFESIS